MTNINSNINIVSLVLIILGVLLLIFSLIFYNNINYIWFWIMYIFGIILIVIGIILLVYYDHIIKTDPPTPLSPPTSNVKISSDPSIYGQAYSNNVSVVASNINPVLISLQQGLVVGTSYTNGYFQLPEGTYKLSYGLQLSTDTNTPIVFNIIDSLNNKINTSQVSSTGPGTFTSYNFIMSLSKTTSIGLFTRSGFTNGTNITISMKGISFVVEQLNENLTTNYLGGVNTNDITIPPRTPLQFSVKTNSDSMSYNNGIITPQVSGNYRIDLTMTITSISTTSPTDYLSLVIGNNQPVLVPGLAIGTVTWSYIFSLSAGEQISFVYQSNLTSNIVRTPNYTVSIYQLP